MVMIIQSDGQVVVVDGACDGRHGFDPKFPLNHQFCNLNKIIKLKMFRIGIDFGGVLSIHDGAAAEHCNTLINMPEAVANVEKLMALGHQLYIISFCGSKRARETKMSVDSTQLKFINQYYVKNKDYKREVCDYLGCHFMIDDRQEILDHIKQHNKQIITIQFGECKQQHPRHKYASNWDEVFNIIDTTPPFEMLPNVDTNLSKLVYNL
jgi:hypothetical protein